VKRPRLLCVLWVTLLAACTLPRRQAPPLLLDGATPPGFAADIRHLSTDRTHMDAAAADGFLRERRAATGAPLSILALSGGGAGGAFGAGALAGLARRGERPQFDVVTGVSTGALLAPFAFLGPKWDAQVKDAFTSPHTERHLALGVLSLLFQSSASRGASLRSLVNQYMTAQLIDAVAQEAAKGRVLLVVTTDLDKQEPVIWNMGKIAAVGGGRARRLFRDVVVASASVPGLYSPVLIRVRNRGRLYDEMHVDGNMTTSMLVASEAAYFVPLDAASLAGASVYVLFNGQLSSLPSTTERALGPILARSFTSTLTHMSRAQLVEVKELTARYGMSLAVTAVPVEHPRIDPLDFRTAAMRALFEFGERCAASGQLWTSVDQLLSRKAREWTRETECPGP
jgi:predicted acylesterase/phospholipase RssA